MNYPLVVESRQKLHAWKLSNGKQVMHVQTTRLQRLNPNQYSIRFRGPYEKKKNQFIGKAFYMCAEKETTLKYLKINFKIKFEN